MKRTPPTTITSGAEPDLFSESPPLEGPFPYRDYVAAREALHAAIRNGFFFGLLLGETGTGKSAIPREIAQGLDRNHKILYLASSSASPLGVSNFVAESLRVAPRRSHVETAKAIADVLKGQPVHHVLWIDEGDKVSKATLGFVRVLAECDLDAPQLMSVVLTGLPELRATLDERELFPLKRRITVRRTLTGLARDELDAFLTHRFGGVAARRLPAATKDDIFERSNGTPALVAKGARAALERVGDGPVNEDTLREAIDDAGL